MRDTCFCRKVSSTLHLSVSLFRQGKRRLNANYNSLQSKRHQRFNVSFAAVRRVLTQSWKCSRLWVTTVFTRRALAFLLCLRLCWHANHTRTASGDVFKIINSRWCCDVDIFIFLRTHESLHPKNTCWCLSHTIVFCIICVSRYHLLPNGIMQIDKSLIKHHRNMRNVRDVRCFTSRLAICKQEPTRTMWDEHSPNFYFVSYTKVCHKRKKWKVIRTAES